MKKGLTIFIGFMHDFAAGCWAATVLAVALLGKYKMESGLAVAINSIQKQFFFIGLGCVVLVFMTGAGRTFTYVDNAYGKEMEQKRRKMLIFKHIVLFSVFGAGIWWQYTHIF